MIKVSEVEKYKSAGEFSHSLALAPTLTLKPCFQIYDLIITFKPKSFEVVLRMLFVINLCQCNFLEK